MKKLIKNLLILVSISLFVVSCEKTEDFTVLNADASTTLSLSTSDIILDKDNAGQEALSLTWTAPEFGFDAAVSYKVILTSGESTAEISVGTDLSKSFEVVELNKILLGFGYQANVQGTVTVQVLGTLSATTEIVSEALTFNATAYVDILDLSTTFGIVGSGFNNWGATPDAPFYTTDTPGVIVSYVNLVNGEIKFRENNDWAVNYGDDGSGSGLALNGGNIAVTAGSYKVTLDLNNLTYAIEDFTIGIVGSSYNNWGASPDFGLTYDPYSDVFRGIVTLLDGEMKFRMNNDWGTNYGDDGVDGVLDLNGANIATTAGIYIVTVNLKDLSYSLEEITSVWGIVGSAYNNWGATPDAQFSRDWSQPFDDIWILKDVTLLDGEYKIRSNNDWGTNYGDDGADGTLELNGANIASVAGTYTIVLDFTDPANPTYTVN
ncbi:MAG: SusE domain-containing protein [Flavobacteriaceae bacterium]|nr:SusE domain-containing protein [Flavobacteriaceae bacterium]